MRARGPGSTRRGSPLRAGPDPASHAQGGEGSAKTKAQKPPLDFTGVWELDEAASKNVSKHMEGALLSVKQNGNRIWIEPSADGREKIMADVDRGRRPPPTKRPSAQGKGDGRGGLGQGRDPSLWIEHDGRLG